MNLAIITCFFNPCRYLQSSRNFLRFVRQQEFQGLPLFVAELAYKYEPWLLPRANSVLRFRANRQNILWHKENLLNALEEALPSEYDAIAWIDADVWFQRLDWYEATCQALDEHCVVQLFDTVIGTGEDGQVISRMRGAAVEGKIVLGQTTPGYAWAARRSLWTDGGGLFERAVIGGGDAVNASAWLPLVGGNALQYRGVERHLEKLQYWFEKNGGKCGYLKDMLWHEWHGNMANRRYFDRHKLVAGLDLDRDLARRDEDGLLEFTPTAPEAARRSIANYFTLRQEDGAHVHSSRNKPDESVLLRGSADLINLLGIKAKAKTYLEIGVRNPAHNFHLIDIEEKEGVDPDPNVRATHAVSSDEFFQKIEPNRRWDIIFIDGMHTTKQTYREIYHALRHLSDGGYLVVHDCNPVDAWRTRSYACAEFERDHEPWNGTVYKAVMALVKFDPLVDICVLDMDDGCGVIIRSERPAEVPSVPVDYFESVCFEDFARDREKSIRLITRKTFVEHFLYPDEIEEDSAQRSHPAESEEPVATALLLNWRRPENLAEVIASIRRQSVSVSIWLWDNSGTVESDCGADVVVRSSKNFRCWPRWLMGALGGDEVGRYVFSLDDDLKMRNRGLIERCVRYLENLEDGEVSSTIVGKSGVVLQPGEAEGKSLPYTRGHHQDADPDRDIEVDVLKGQFLFFNRQLLEGVPLNRADEDDIRLSSFAKRCIIPSFMAGAFQELPNHDSLCGQPGHYQRRDEAVLRYGVDRIGAWGLRDAGSECDRDLM